MMTDQERAEVEEILRKNAEKRSSERSEESPTPESIASGAANTAPMPAEATTVTATVEPKPTTSSRKVEANRQNSRLSTGPKTPRGKKYSSMNAITHGVFSTRIVIDRGDGAESREEFDALLAALADDLKPGSQAEELLVLELAVTKWRLMRIPRYEVGAIRLQADSVGMENRRSLARRREEYVISFGGFASDGRKQLEELSSSALEWRIEALEAALREIRESCLGNRTVRLLAMLFGPGAFFGEETPVSLEAAGRAVPRLEGQLNYIRRLLTDVKLEEELRLDATRLARSLPPINELDSLARYEAMLERKLVRIYAELRELQRLRLQVPSDSGSGGGPGANLIS